MSKYYGKVLSGRGCRLVQRCSLGGPVFVFALVSTASICKASCRWQSSCRAPGFLGAVMALPSAPLGARTQGLALAQKE